MLVVLKLLSLSRGVRCETLDSKGVRKRSSARF